MKDILQKYIADSGLCSRRQAEELIRSGAVEVNGRPAELGMRAGEDDDVRVHGQLIVPAKEKIYIILNKPKGYVCSNRKFKGEKNIFELLEKSSFRSPTSKALEVGLLKLHAVGRLDKDSTGLVLLTNDGAMTMKMTHPRFAHEKEYLVEISRPDGGVPASEISKRFSQGIDIGEGDGVVRAKKVVSVEDNKFKIILTQGKKRQIRRMFGALGCGVVDLKRIRIGNIELGALEEGRWRKIKIN